jgi:hypothetical protein
MDLVDPSHVMLGIVSAYNLTWLPTGLSQYVDSRTSKTDTAAGSEEGNQNVFNDY